MTPLLEVKGLSVSFGGHEVVHGIDFSLAAGEKLALVGESGSGKTVSALSLLRLIHNAEVRGTAHFGGTDLLSLNEHALRGIRGDRIAVIFQEPMTALNPLYSVGEQIVEVLQLKKGLTTAQARSGRHRVAGLDWHPRARPARRGVSAPAQRRSAPARHDRHGAGGPAEVADRRRADHCPGTSRCGPRSWPCSRICSASTAWRCWLITHDLNLVRRFADPGGL